MPITYEQIKDMARQFGVSTEDLIALSPNNDPFYVGKPRDLIDGGWFAGLWRRFRYREGVHLRRVHYQLISQDPLVLLPRRHPFTTDSDGAVVMPNHTLKGPREVKGKPVPGDSLRLFPGTGQGTNLQENRTYYVRAIEKNRFWLNTQPFSGPIAVVGGG